MAAVVEMCRLECYETTSTQPFLSTLVKINKQVGVTFFFFKYESFELINHKHGSSSRYQVLDLLRLDFGIYTVQSLKISTISQFEID